MPAGHRHLALLVLLPAFTLAQSFSGIDGAAPTSTAGRPGCFLYERWVVTTGPEAGGEGSWVRVSRRSGAARDEAAACALAPEAERRLDPGDEFAGMVGDVLLVRLAGSANGGSLVLERLGKGADRRVVSYAWREPRVTKGSLELFAPLEASAAACGAELFVRGVDHATCEARARKWVACRRRAGGPRLASAPDPLDRAAFSGAGAGTDCQVRLYEEVRVDLATLAVARSGLLRVAVSYVATE